MKHNKLRSIAHNIAASLASGVGLLIGLYMMDIFGEARASRDGFLTIDFLTGTIANGQPSQGLAKAVLRYKEILPRFCEKHEASISDFRELTACYYGRFLKPRFVVTVEDRTGRRSSTEGDRLRNMTVLSDTARGFSTALAASVASQ